MRRFIRWVRRLTRMANTGTAPCEWCGEPWPCELASFTAIEIIELERDHDTQRR